MHLSIIILSIHLSVYTYIYLSIRLSIYLTTYLFVYLSMYSYISPSVSIYLSVYVSIYRSTYPSISPCEVFTFGGFTSLQLCFINGPFSCTAFYRAFHKHSAKPADVTFRRIDWTDDSLNRCSVMVLINTNYAFWLRLTDLLGARTSASGETSEER